MVFELENDSYVVNDEQDFCTELLADKAGYLKFDPKGSDISTPFSTDRIRRIFSTASAAIPIFWYWMSR